MSKTLTWQKDAGLSRTAFFALLFIMVAVTLHFGALSSQAAQASLSWSAPTTYTDGKPLTTLKGYKVHAGTAAGSYSQSVDVGNTTSYTMAGLDDATTYYFAVTAYDTSGYASGYSNQATLTTPAGTSSTQLYTLAASAGAGGTITPSGSIAISKGLSQSFAIAPSTGYRIADVKVDGASVGALSSYTFSNVAANHTIAASFAAATTGSFSITASASAGGTISPAGASTVASGGSKSYTITPNAGYYLASVTVDGKVIASNLASYSYTFSNVTASHTISATFAVATYTITASAGTNGTISPSGTAYINYGSNASYTITPSSGYRIASVLVDGVSVGAVSSYTFTAVKAKHTIAATFSANTTSTATTTVIPRTGWKLKWADSQELVGQNGGAANAFDGNNGTIWHTKWLNGSPAAPHEIQIDLGKSYTLNGLRYLPRQDGSSNGTIARYEFYVSADGVNWGTAVATGTFANSSALKSVSFAAKAGRYVRLRALSEVNGNPWTSAAEINVTGY